MKTACISPKNSTGEKLVSAPSLKASLQLWRGIVSFFQSDSLNNGRDVQKVCLVVCNNSTNGIWCTWLLLSTVSANPAVTVKNPISRAFYSDAELLVWAECNPSDISCNRADWINFGRTANVHYDQCESNGQLPLLGIEGLQLYCDSHVTKNILVNMKFPKNFPTYLLHVSNRMTR